MNIHQRFKKPRPAIQPVFFILAICTLITFALVRISFAQNIKSAHTEVELITESIFVQPGQSTWLALRMTMENGWHVYWRNAGDSGLAPKIKWQPTNETTFSQIHWPYPHRIILDSLTSYGYEKEVFLLIEAFVASDVREGTIIDVRANVEWLACKILCVPGRAELNTKLLASPAVDAPVSPHRKTFEQARLALPYEDPQWSVETSYNQETITLAIVPPKDFSKKTSSLKFFPYEDKLIDHAFEQKFRKKGDEYDLTLKRSVLSGKPHLEEVRGVLVSDVGWDDQGRRKSLAIHSQPVRIAKKTVGQNQSEQSIWMACVFAFIGGLILNLMPCVLPILSIKVLNLVQQSSHGRGSTIKHGLLFSLGIISAFCFLAAIIISIKLSGQYVGWGFQFQSPVFLIFLSGLFFLMAINLFGVFEMNMIHMPGSVPTGKSLTYRQSFLNGVLATVVASPCTAPFMGSAIGFALTQSLFVCLLIFVFLGLGMSAPYLLLSAFPALLSFVPKPGAWMIHLKRVFALLLLGTVAWLVWILGLQQGPVSQIMLAIGFFIILFGGWYYGKQKNQMQGSSAGLVFVLLIALGVAVPVGYVIKYGDEVVVSERGSQKSLQWHAFSQESVNQYLDEGKSVFIDFTAAWCLSCQVNKKIALNNRKVIKLFKELDIVTVRADLTNNDPEVIKALSGFGKSSIPLYVYYLKGQQSNPKFLPEILTPTTLMNALKEKK